MTILRRPSFSFLQMPKRLAGVVCCGPAEVRFHVQWLKQPGADNILSVAEALEIARDVARKLIEARRERGTVPPPSNNHRPS